MPSPSRVLNALLWAILADIFLLAQGGCSAPSSQAHKDLERLQNEDSLRAISHRWKCSGLKDDALDLCNKAARAIPRHNVPTRELKYLVNSRDS